MLFFMQNALADATWFITKWRTTTANENIIIPISSSYTYNYDIDCDNDVTFEQTGVTGNGTCTYASAGEHIINIKGDFPAIYINNSSMKDKILDVMQWGNIAWQSMKRAFAGASNLQVSATDSPNLSSVTDISNMFSGASSFNQDISSWDVSKVINMEITRL
ncbi:MAG TPA: BspA family leucine-rich repeat surface protein [Thioploca sp.]|nr:BspA family leucine-rich repeat surface protein [Thioploca sp.]